MIFKKKDNDMNQNWDYMPDKYITGALRKAVIIAVVGLFALATVSSTVYSVSETESAVITTFGKATLNENKGLQVKIPFIQKVRHVDTTVHGFTIGYKVEMDKSNTDVDSESIMITKDFNFVDIDYYVSYEVTDPIKYLYNASSPETILKNMSMSCIRSVMSAYTVDAALTTGKTEIQSNVKQMIMERLEAEDIGIKLVDATIQDVEPPTEEVNNAFKAVETAKQDKESTINDANKYRNEQLPEAEAEADKIIQEAEAKKTARINEANGQVARFEAEYAEYQNYPLITKRRMFYESMKDILPNLKVIIDDGSGNIQKHYPIEEFSSIQADTSAFKSEEAS